MTNEPEKWFSTTVGYMNFTFYVEIKAYSAAEARHQLASCLVYHAKIGKMVPCTKEDEQ